MECQEAEKRGGGVREEGEKKKRAKDFSATLCMSRFSVRISWQTDSSHEGGDELFGDVPHGEFTNFPHIF